MAGSQWGLHDSRSGLVSQPFRVYDSCPAMPGPEAIEVMKSE